MEGGEHKACGNRYRGSGSPEEERQPRMSPNYDSNMISKHNNFIQSEIHMTHSITLSNVGQLNHQSLSHRHFQH